MLYSVKIRPNLDWLLLALLIFSPRLLQLGVFLTPDEPLFLEHARAFAAGLSSGNFTQTLGIGYPGVTVAWWTAPVVGLATTELGAYVAGRFITALATGLLLLGLYALARRLLGKGPALLGSSLLALDPYLLSYSRLFHIEATLALLMTLAGLSWLLRLGEHRRRWLILAGIFTGLALLTKSTALLLGPMLLVITGGWAWRTGHLSQGRWWLTTLHDLGLLAVIAVVIFWALWPAMWVTPVQALNLTFDKLLTDQEAGAGNLGMFWLGRFVEDPGPFFYPVAFLLKATPWLLLGLGFSLWTQVAETRKRGSAGEQPFQEASRGSRGAALSGGFAREQGRRGASNKPDLSLVTRHSSLVTLPLWFFALTYLLLMTIASKKSIRYLLPAFPTFYLLMGLAFHQVLEGWKAGKLGEKRNSPLWGGRGAYSAPSPRPDRSAHNLASKKSILPSSHLPVFTSLFTIHYLPFTIILLLAIALLPFYHPYYFTYFNPLLLGWRWAPQTLLVGWGEGLDQAAGYLNQQPGGTVTAWYESLFPLFYRGPVAAVVPQENLLTAGHTVLYLNQVQRDIPGPTIVDYFQSRRRPEHTVRLAGIEYAWVYPGPVVSLERPDPTPQFPLGGDFGGEAHLLGYDLHPQPRSGEPLIVTLYWRVLAQPAGERFVYVRLVDAQGQVWASVDSPPVLGLWPVTRWQPGLLIEDAQALSIPPGTPPGLYRLEVGLYEPQSGQPLPAGGQPPGQGGGLLLGEVQVEWQPVKAEPDLPHQTEARLAPNARLVGYTPLSERAITGDLLPVDLAWREAAPLARLWTSPPNNLVRFEWRTEEQEELQPAGAEQFDALPLPVEQWGRGALLRSKHEVLVPPDLKPGVYTVWVSLHTGSDPAGEKFQLGRVEVSTPPREFALPSTAGMPVGLPQLAEGINLAGYQLNHSGDELALELYWQTSAPLKSRYKVFVQLLGADNTLIAQSDSFPAGGQRPTTGWLPGEIVTDPHTLALPADLPPGAYRLITGLYNPISGERLPRLDGQGQVTGDSILVTEVTLP